MNCYEVLGIEETYEIKKIKKAYAARTREYHPEDHPEEFQVIHAAYEEALGRARWMKAQAEEKAEAPGFDGQPAEPAGRASEACGFGGRPGESEEREPEAGGFGGRSEESAGRESEACGFGAPAEASAGTANTAEDFGGQERAEENPCGQWREQFERIAGDGGRNAGINWMVRRLMEEFHVLYMNEAARSKLYRWRDYFDEPFDPPQMAEVFASREFVEAWYQFLGSHHIFTTQVWQYFASVDGYRFNSEQYGIPRFPYHLYIEQVQSLERAIGWGQEETQEQTNAGGPAEQAGTGRPGERADANRPGENNPTIDGAGRQAGQGHPDFRAAQYAGADRTDRTGGGRQERRDDSRQTGQGRQAGQDWQAQGAPDQAVNKRRKSRKKLARPVKVVLYLAGMVAATIGSTVLGVIAGLIFG